MICFVAVLGAEDATYDCTDDDQSGENSHSEPQAAFRLRAAKRVRES